MTLQRMDNVLIVVEDLESAKAFFVELGMELEGETDGGGTRGGPSCWTRERSIRDCDDADPGWPWQDRAGQVPHAGGGDG
jgi:catechol 2,3-dioxygenase-like lactoylglutathione lyase family enzyme